MSGFGQLGGLVAFVALLVAIYMVDRRVHERKQRSQRSLEREVQARLYPTRRERVSIPTSDPRDVDAPGGLTARSACDVGKHV